MFIQVRKSNTDLLWNLRPTPWIVFWKYLQGDKDERANRNKCIYIDRSHPVHTYCDIFYITHLSKAKKRVDVFPDCNCKT